MHLVRPILLSLSFLSYSFGAVAEDTVLKERYDYQSDVARLRKIVINSLYSHKEVFLRELISNANDALEKLRITSLTDKTIWDGNSDNLNITIKVVKSEDTPGGKIVITDTGIGMTPEELKKNLGTLAKSGTSEFLARAEGQDSAGTGNLIGAFGLGFYSSFLVADRVDVASITPPSEAFPDPVQHVFTSTADDSAFDIYPDPRGNSLGRGTEITLHLKDDSLDYLNNEALKTLVEKHSSFSSSFPIYLYNVREDEVPDEDDASKSPVDTPEDNDLKDTESEEADSEEDEELDHADEGDAEENITEEEVAKEEVAEEDRADSEDAVEPADLEESNMEDIDAGAIEPEDADPDVKPEADEEEGIVEDVTDEDEEDDEPPAPKTKLVSVEEWIHLNGQPPIWQRDPKTVNDAEYEEFYKATFKDSQNPLAWQHFSGDSGSGVSFKAIIYLPSDFGEEFWQQQQSGAQSGDVRLMVKRVFITSDLGKEALPKWASWVKVIVDADDLPLNVSRETLQSNAFLRQLKQIILKRIIQLFTKLAEDKEGVAKWDQVQRVYGTVLKLAAVEDTKNRDKLLELTRFVTNQRASTSLSEYIANKKKGQKQIFYISEMGKETKDLAKSVFVEKLHARGYEVLLLNEPLDEIMVQNVRLYKTLPFQDVAKAGLKFGDEDSDAEEEKKNLKEMTTKFQPLIDYLKKEAKDAVMDVAISNRLVTSPCAVVADTYGYTANVQRMMSASSKSKNDPNNFMHEMATKARKLEINPRSPLIEGLLRRLEAITVEEGEEKDLEAEEELKEVVSILVDGALIRSGFDVPDTNDFFTRVDKVLRRSLGVSETAQADSSVKPAPPVDPEITEDGEDEDPLGGKPGVVLPDHLKDDIKIEMDEIDENGDVVDDEHDDVVDHDEL